MSPVWMILSSLLGVAFLSAVFGVQQALRLGRAARRRLLRESGRLGPIAQLPAPDALAKRGRTD